MNRVSSIMSTYTSGGTHQRQRHDAFLPIAVTIMLAACFAIIFGLNPQAGGYGGGNSPALFYESAGLMFGAVLIGYVGLVFKAT